MWASPWLQISACLLYPHLMESGGRKQTVRYFLLRAVVLSMQPLCEGHEHLSDGLLANSMMMRLGFQSMNFILMGDVHMNIWTWEKKNHPARWSRYWNLSDPLTPCWIKDLGDIVALPMVALTERGINSRPRWCDHWHFIKEQEQNQGEAADWRTREVNHKFMDFNSVNWRVDFFLTQIWIWKWPCR